MNARVYLKVCTAQMCRQTLTLLFVIYFAEADTIFKAEADRKTVDGSEIRSLLYSEEHKYLVRNSFYLLETQTLLEVWEKGKHNLEGNTAHNHLCHKNTSLFCVQLKYTVQ